MQISRHWRMQEQRYQLTGTRYEDGEISFQDRPRFKTDEKVEEPNRAETPAIPIKNWPKLADLKTQR